MTDFRALCAELVDDLELCDWPYKLKETIRADIDRARAALADEPAVPSPPADGPTDDEVEVLADQLGLIRGHANHPCGFWINDGDAGALARAVLARWGNPAPQPPAEGEVAELVRLLGSMAAEAELADQVHDASVLDRAADLLHRLSPPQPVPVSERLPGAEDCDTEGRYWGLINGCEAWVLGKGSPSTLNITHWLPAHALPIPHQQENAND